MSKFEKVKDMKDAEFRRLTGVQKVTFGQMLEVYEASLNKKSKIHLAPQVILLADSGYQGVQNLHISFLTPLKSNKLKPLTKTDKKENKELWSMRIKVENALAFIKRFRILPSRYRNRKRRFGLRFNPFAAICNFEINLT